MNFIFWRRVKAERELEEEIRSHLRMAAQEHIETAGNDADAQAAARREFGNSDLVKEATREVWGLGWVERFTQDFRYGFRILWKSPVYALVSVLTLALGIGASTAIFSVVYGVMLRSLPYYKAGQIVRMWEVNAAGRNMQFADPNFDDMRSQTTSLQGMAQMYSDESLVFVGHESDRLRVAHVSQDFFAVMGIKPVIGRLFSPDEQHLGAMPAALVSYSYWKSHLHQATDLSAMKFTASKTPATIIGVLPPGFSFPDNSQVWVARETADVHMVSRSAHNWQVVARLRDGVSLDQARADASAIAHRLYQQYHSADMNMVDAAVLPLRDALTANVKPALLVLFGVAGLLLLVACANVMNLTLAQASARRGELAVRAALGASRGRMVRQFLAEALLLCLLGGCLGVLAAYFGVSGLLTLAPSSIPRLSEVSVNLPVLWFALGLSLLVAAGLGVLTAFRATSGDVQSTLTEGGRRQGTTLRSQRTGRIIVAGQVAITLTLLVGAGLLGRSMLQVLSVHPGFETEHILTLDLKMPEVEPGMENQRVQFLDQLISRLRAMPGVQSVGGTDTIPLQSDAADGRFTVVNPEQLSPSQRNFIERSAHTRIANANAAYLSDFTAFLKELWDTGAQTGDADYVVAGEGFFQTLGIPLRKGRMFNNADGPDTSHVAVISESVARQKWPDQDPIGHTIEFGNMDGDLRLLTIVGVVGDVRTHSIEATPRPTIYVDYRQRPRGTSQFNIVLRTSSDPTATFAAARRILGQLDPTVPPRFSTFTEIFSESLNSRRFNLLLVSIFAVAALLLAMAGIFGVLAYSVARRTREMGVRIALGATTGNVLRLVLKQEVATALVGITIGLAGSFILTRTMRSLLFQVSPTDPLTIVAVALLLMFVATIASYIPARRATRVDPLEALRYE